MESIDSGVLRGQLKLYFIMGSVNCRKSPAEVLTEAIAGGITMFQFREKGAGSLSAQDTLALGKQLQLICRSHGVPFIVNDDIALALALDADGVHVGQDDEPVQQIRQQLGQHKIVGVSAHTLAEARLAVSGGADYLGIGPVYPTVSKEDAKPASGTVLIEEIRRHGLTVPLVGIGGITAENSAPVITAGADGISVISAIAGAGNIPQAARDFIQAIS